jgi:hypothetical protein
LREDIACSSLILSLTDSLFAAGIAEESSIDIFVSPPKESSAS